MNIFYLHHNPMLAALQHVDRHVCKMPIEVAQMLSTAHHMIDGDEAPRDIYKPCFQKHPCTLWVRESLENYKWTVILLDALLDEFRFRYGTAHGTSRVFPALSKPPKKLTSQGLTPPAQAMPEQFKHPDAITAYRQYYLGAKQHIHRWTKRPIPRWIITKELTNANSN